MLNYPKTRLGIALDTARTVREILDLLLDQGDLAEALVNLAVLDAYDVIEQEDSLCKSLPKVATDTKSSKSDPQFGFDTQEVSDLGEDDDDDDCESDSISFKIRH